MVHTFTQTVINMGLVITPISFSASALLKSADMNTNWGFVTGATNFSGIWNSSNVASTTLTIEDATTHSVNVIRIRSSSASLSRGIIFENNAGAAVLYTDSSGNINGLTPSRIIGSTSVPYVRGGYFTGTGHGNFTSGLTQGIYMIFTQKNTSTVVASVNGTGSLGFPSVEASSSGTNWVILGWY